MINNKNKIIFNIYSKNKSSIAVFLNRFSISKNNSHKGENGKVLIVGGSSLFHSASIWAAEISSHFVDMVHYSSTKENNKIILGLKSKFQNGMVIAKENLLDYVKEDNVVLVGPGMVRGKKEKIWEKESPDFADLLRIDNEAKYTYFLTKYLITTFSEKKYVFDAGALQMMNKQWLLKLKNQAILTPHSREFEKLFEISLAYKSHEEKAKIVKEKAEKYNVTILLKSIVDIVSDGKQTAIIYGGNQGLTKGGTGDILAGLATSFYCKNNSFDSCVLSSYILKRTSEMLFKSKGYWYNIDDVINTIPSVFKDILLD